MAKVLTGLDIIVREQFSRLTGKRVGVLAHAGSVDSGLRHIVDLSAEERSFSLMKIFGPEHGLRGAIQYMAEVSSGVDKKTALPVISLYGHTADSLRPKESDLQDLDLFVIDLPDVGARYYTYAQTMSLCMEVAGRIGLPIMVLDRPNPIGGSAIEGAPLLSSCRSFCGYTPVANRHGLTLGELAKVYQAGFGSGADRYPEIPCTLEVVRMEGWSRKMYFDQTEQPWVLPSPNIPTLTTAIVYPGGCLLEGTRISEGRGTTLPFEFIGAPYIDGDDLITAMKGSGFQLRGATLRPVSFIPHADKCKAESCGGVQIHVTDRETFQSFRWTLALLGAVKKLYPTDFQWRGDAYEFVKSVPAIDLLYGSPHLRETIDRGDDPALLDPELVRFENHYRSEIAPFQLYR